MPDFSVVVPAVDTTIVEPMVPLDGTLRQLHEKYGLVYGYE